MQHAGTLSLNPNAEHAGTLSLNPSCPPPFLSRPTAVNLADMAGKLKVVARAAAAEPGATPAALVERVVLACEACMEEDIAANQVGGAGTTSQLGAWSMHYKSTRCVGQALPVHQVRGSGTTSPPGAWVRHYKSTRCVGQALQVNQVRASGTTSPPGA